MLHISNLISCYSCKIYRPIFFKKSEVTNKRRNLSWKLGLHFLVFVVAALPQIVVFFQWQAFSSAKNLNRFRDICDWKILGSYRILLNNNNTAGTFFLCRGVIDPLIHIFCEKILRNPVNNCRRQRRLDECELRSRNSTMIRTD